MPVINSKPTASSMRGSQIKTNLVKTTEIKVLKEGEESLKLKPEHMHDVIFFDELIGIKNPNWEIIKKYNEKHGLK